MKILFVTHDLGFTEPIAIAYLSAIAKQLNHLTFFCSLDRDNLTSVVEKIRPDIVAYSVNIIGYAKTIKAHKEVRASYNFISIMGGPHPTYSPETFKESGMDIYCVGEGEYAFKEFLIAVANGDSYHGIANFITRLAANPPRPLITNLDELPLPDRDLMIANTFLKNAAKKTFLASRGCPFKCAYCCNNYYHNLYKGKGPLVRRFSVERVLREIEDVKSKYRMDFIKFGDDCFAIKADEWLEEFAEKYPKRVDVPFNCYLRLDIIDDQMLKLLKKAGCYSVHLSVDSTSHYVREQVLQRQMRDENLIDKIRKVKEYKINTWVNYMLAAPESTLKDDLDTIQYSKKTGVTYTAYSTTVPMERTALYDYTVQRGYIDPLNYIGDLSGCTEKSVLSCFSEKEKKIRYNIFLVGAIIAKLPFPLDKIATSLIKIIPPNALFKKINDVFYKYSIENKIFKLPNDSQKTQRIWTRDN